jgi:methylenetetrahydrofolate--tRNA-(uracil-5-)-methyltransferase
MRPVRSTAAHKTDFLAELVCSNTFKSTELVSAHGLLKAELRILGSLVLSCADDARVAAGSALAVDRDAFAAAVTERIHGHAAIEVVREEVTALPENGIVATGPLTSNALATAIQERLGVEQLAFYDAIAPIIDVDSIDHNVVFRASRYGKETMSDAADEGAYINCPLARDEYEAFIDALLGADQHVGHEFDKVPYFESCMPIEEMAARGRETLRFGPMKLRSEDRPPRAAESRFEAVCSARSLSPHGKRSLRISRPVRLRPRLRTSQDPARGRDSSRLRSFVARNLPSRQHT